MKVLGGCRFTQLISLSLSLSPPVHLTQLAPSAWHDKLYVFRGNTISSSADDVYSLSLSLLLLFDYNIQ
jgi:hypothetical protein